MSEREFEAALAELFSIADEVADDIGATVATGARVRTFDQAALLTRDHGLVIELPDGSEFQITIRRSL
jgi:hypothetical protein